MRDNKSFSKKIIILVFLFSLSLILILAPFYKIKAESSLLNLNNQIMDADNFFFSSLKQQNEPGGIISDATVECYPDWAMIDSAAAYLITGDPQYRIDAFKQWDYVKGRINADHLPIRSQLPQGSDYTPKDKYISRDVCARNIIFAFLMHKIFGEGQYSSYIEYADRVAEAMITIPGIKPVLPRDICTFFSPRDSSANNLKIRKKIFASVYYKGSDGSYHAVDNEYYVDTNQNAAVGLAFYLLYNEPRSNLYKNNNNDYRNEAFDIYRNELDASLAMQDPQNNNSIWQFQNPINDQEKAETTYGSYTAFLWSWASHYGNYEGQGGQNQISSQVKSAAAWFKDEYTPTIHPNNPLYNYNYQNRKGEKTTLSSKELWWRIPVYLADGGTTPNSHNYVQSLVTNYIKRYEGEQVNLWDYYVGGNYTGNKQWLYQTSTQYDGAKYTGQGKLDDYVQHRYMGWSYLVGGQMNQDKKYWLIDYNPKADSKPIPPYMTISGQGPGGTVVLPQGVTKINYIVSAPASAKQIDIYQMQNNHGTWPTVWSGINIFSINNNARFATATNQQTSNTITAGNIYQYLANTVQYDGSYSGITPITVISPPWDIVKINNNATYTTTTNVTLNLSFSKSVTQYRISNNNASYTSWHTCKADNITWNNWNLTSYGGNGSDGTKTVYVQCKYNYGKVDYTSPTTSDSIILDTHAPYNIYFDNISNQASHNISFKYHASDATAGVRGVSGRYRNVATGEVGSWKQLYLDTVEPLEKTIYQAGSIQVPSDGRYKIQIIADDGARNVSEVITSNTFISDTQAPTGSVIINNGATYTTSNPVTLTLSATDAGTGVAGMCFSNDGVSYSSWQSFSPSKSWSLSSGDGVKTVYVKFKDGLGNISQVFSDSIILDRVAPTGSISINSGNAYTTSTSVTLTLSATDPNGSGVNNMCFSNNGSSWSSWQSYTTSKSWTLSSGDGTKYVYVKYSDKAGNICDPYSDTIILDTQAPTGTTLIAGGNTYATTTNATLTLNASDATSGVNSMCFSNDGSSYSSWESYNTTRSWTLAYGDGVKTVFTKYRDKAGNVGGPFSDTIILDTQAPTGSILINGGDSETTTSNVTLTLNATDSGSGVKYMCFSNDGSSFSSWQSYTTSKSWTLSSGSGTKTVYVKFKDKAGNISNTFSDTIEYIAGEVTFVEDFTTETYKDTSNTNADWNTAKGKLRLKQLGWTKADGKTSGYNNVSSNSGRSVYPSLALDTSGNPHIAWEDETSGINDIYYTHWNGTQWVKADGTPGFDTNISQGTAASQSAPCLKLDKNNRPHISWNKWGTLWYDHCYTHWDGEKWAKANGSPGYDVINIGSDGWNPENRFDLDFGIDSHNYPHFVWSGANLIKYRYWTGSEWSPIEIVDSSSGECATITLDCSNNPHVTWSHQVYYPNWEVYYKYRIGGVWKNRSGGSQPDNISNNSGQSGYPQLSPVAIDTSGNPHIAWEDNTPGNWEIFYKYWDGTDWKSLGSNENISQNNGASQGPYLVLDSQNNPNITWYDNTEGNNEIFFSRWNGHAWTKADGVTSGYDNVSNNSGDSLWPPIILDAKNRANIVWMDNTPGNYDIFFSKWSGYANISQAQSFKVNKVEKTVLRATLEVTENFNGGGITYYLSANGGTNWEQVTPHAEHIFTYQGNDLRWKAVLSTNNPFKTPEIDTLTIKYSYF